MVATSDTVAPTARASASTGSAGRPRGTSTKFSAKLAAAVNASGWLRNVENTDPVASAMSPPIVDSRPVTAWPRFAPSAEVSGLSGPSSIVAAVWPRKFATAAASAPDAHAGVVVPMSTLIAPATPASMACWTSGLVNIVATWSRTGRPIQLTNVCVTNPRKLPSANWLGKLVTRL